MPQQQQMPQARQGQQMLLYTKETALAIFRMFFHNHPDMKAAVRQLPRAQQKAHARNVWRRVMQLLQTWQAQQMQVWQRERPYITNMASVSPVTGAGGTPGRSVNRRSTSENDLSHPIGA